jgi:FkbM family methyltransferase
MAGKSDPTRPVTLPARNRDATETADSVSMRQQPLRRLAADFWGIQEILGLPAAVGWLTAVAGNWRGIARDRNLQPADQAMGLGPFLVRKPGTRTPFRITGAGAFSGIREMYVRDCYLQGGALSIDDRGVVLDLGANMGNFTNLALAHGSRIRVVAAEPNIMLEERFWASVSLNEGFRERTQFVRAFLGTPGHRQRQMESTGLYPGSPYLSEEDVLQIAGASRVNFLKCDIEGGEFSFFGPDSPLLAITAQLAIEIHAFAGDVDSFIASIVSRGLEVRHLKRDPDGTCTLLARRACHRA